MSTAPRTGRSTGQRGWTSTRAHIRLVWGVAYGKAHRIETSNDGKTLTTIYSTTTCDGGFDDIDVNASGRYVRLTGTARGTEWGYSLWEFGVYH